MAESPDGTIVQDPADPGLTDAYGLVYRLTPSRQVTVNGTVDRSIAYAQRIVYAQRQVWIQEASNHWRARRHHNDPWSPPMHNSPLILDQLADILAAIQNVLTVVSNISTPVETLNQIAQTVDLIQTQVAVLTVNQSALSTAVAALQDPANNILASVSRVGPVSIALDLANAEIASQPVPSAQEP